MNTPTANIFDLLLGPVDPTVQGVIGEGAGKMPEDNLFGDMLGQLIAGSTGVAFGQTISKAVDNSSNGFPSNLLLAGQASEALASTPLTAEPEIVTDAIPTRQASLPDVNPQVQMLQALVQPAATANVLPELGSAVQELIPGDTAPSNVVAFNEDLQTLLPQSVPIENASLLTALRGQPVTIKDGTYRIVNQHQTDQSLNLEIVSDDESKPIRISLPLSQLKAQADDVGRRTPIVSLLDQGEDKYAIGQLLKKLNLRQLTVSRQTTEISVARGEAAAEIVIAADDQGRSIKLTQQLPQPNLVGIAMPPQRAIVRKIDGWVSTDVKSVSVGNQESMTRSTFVDDDNKIVGQSRISDILLALSQNQTSEQLGSRSAFSMSTGSASVASDGAAAAADTMSFKGESQAPQMMAAVPADQMPESTEARTVRFHIPQDASQHLKSSRHEIQIRIEPDNLGPARLSLSISGDRIRAHLVVESAEAKALIESRLDHLIRQLDRAQIKFDQIVVTVAGGEERHEFHERYPRRPLAKRIPKIENDNAEMEVPKVLAPAMASRQYIGSQSVNVLA